MHQSAPRHCGAFKYLDGFTASAQLAAPAPALELRPKSGMGINAIILRKSWIRAKQSLH